MFVFADFGGLWWLGGTEGILIDLECGREDSLNPPTSLDLSGLDFSGVWRGWQPLGAGKFVPGV